MMGNSAHEQFPPNPNREPSEEDVRNLQDKSDCELAPVDIIGSSFAYSFEALCDRMKVSDASSVSGTSKANPSLVKTAQTKRGQELLGMWRRSLPNSLALSRLNELHDLIVEYGADILNPAKLHSIMRLTSDMDDHIEAAVTALEHLENEQKFG